MKSWIDWFVKDKWQKVSLSYFLLAGRFWRNPGEQLDHSIYILIVFDADSEETSEK